MRIIIALALLACSVSGALGQQKMIANYIAMPDLRCVGGFLATDGFWAGDDNPLDRSQRWVRISSIHDIMAVEGIRAGPDEPGYRVSTKYPGLGTPAVQHKVHLLQPPEVFLEFLAKCERDRGAHSIPRISPDMAAP